MRKKSSDWIWILLTCLFFGFGLFLIFNRECVLRFAHVKDVQISDTIGSYVSGLIGTLIGSAIGIFSAITTQRIHETAVERKQCKEKAELAAQMLKSEFVFELQKAKREILLEEIAARKIAGEYVYTHGLVHEVITTTSSGGLVWTL